MKCLQLFIVTSLFIIGGINAQPMNFNNNNYPTEWKEIQELEEKALPKSALEKVELLFNQAKKDNNPSQIIKTTIYRAKYSSELEEDGFVKAVAKMHAEMEAETFPTKQIMQSMLAEMYAGYLENNVWQFRNRTTTPTFKTDDMRTWTIPQLNDEAAMLHRLALNDDRTKNVPIANFNAITTEGADVLRPTLFDFLAHRAIDFFSDEKSYLTKPNYKFELDTEGALLQADEFIKVNFESKDSTSGKLWAMRLLQELTRFHLADASPEALIDADLKRLEFAHTHSILDLKDNLYLKSLEFLRNKFADNPSYVEVSLKLAQYHRDKAGNFKADAANNAFKNENKIALEIAKEAIKKYPKAYGIKSCKELIDQITEPSIDMRLEEVVAPNKPLLAHINFKNTDSIHYKVIRLYERVGRREFEDDEQRLKYYNNLPFVVRKMVKLPNDGDFNTHSTEIKIDKLPLGMYLILAADNNKFSTKNGGKAHYLTFHVSNIAYFHRSGDTEANEFVVVDRTTGAPFPSVTAEFWESRYDQKLRRDIRSKIGNAVSNSDGFVYPRMPKDKYYTLRFIYGKDTLGTGDGYSNYFYKPEKQKYQITEFFLDRKIYRPSQTVYFKGIVIEKTTDNDFQELTGERNAAKIVANEPVEVTFFDVNHQKITSLSLKTNQFGTFNGSFIAPSSGLLGNMQISCNKNGAVNLKVEEYKRPKFEAKVEPLEGSFVLEQTVPVIGHATAFAGNNIDGALVKYRVVRQARFPYWSWGWRPSYTEGGQEIAHGETTTDATGKFTINFKAIADRTIKKEDKPVFNYEIIVDVTDINGETHSTTGSVSIGYTSLLPTIEVGDEIEKSNLKPIKIITKNLNGQPLAIKGKVKIDLLTSPRRPYITRHWNLPDTQTIDEAVFRRDFPLYPFKEEDKEQNWVVKRTVLEKDFETKTTPSVSAGIDTSFLTTAEFKKYQTGMYRMTVNTIDPTTGEKIDIVKHFMLSDLTEDVVPCNKTFFVWQPKEAFEPNETAKITVGTANDMLHVLVEEELDGKLITIQWLALESLKHYEVKLTERSRGNHFVHLSYAINNRASFRTETLVVPFKNKELTIEYATFKDKLEPGSDEEWRIKISGDKKEKVAAEMVAAMYDASLDQFAPNHWGLNLYNNRHPLRGFDAPTFGEAVSTNFYNYTEGSNAGADEPHNYRQFNWFNFNFAEAGHRPIAVAFSRAMPAMAMDAASAPAPQMRGGEAKAKMMKAEKGANDEVRATGNILMPELMKSVEIATKEKAPDLSAIKTRSNLNETVFFFPELMTDENGDVIIKFKMNEALTKWKFMTLAHTTDLKVGYSERTLVTQKDLMLFPNAPRFLREGDEIELSAKISNLTSQAMQGSAQLLLFDALTMQPVDDILDNKNAVVPFDMQGNLSTSVNWTLKIPIGKVQAITYKIVAKAGNFSDGEENTLPVLTNRLLVTEALPLSIRGGETKKFTFESLKNSDKSKTLTHQALTLEFTSNPAWYAVQALPYLMEYPYECTEQIFSRFYANSLATNVANAHPKIKTVFERWRTIDTKALQSNLTKNQELKTALLEETPWVLAAQSEEVQKKNIGLLFDLNKMANESATALRKMSERQLSNGGFAWFPGGRDSWFITQYIVEGFGHLDALGVKNQDAVKENMVNKSLVYCDNRFNEEYADLEKRVGKQQAKWEDDNLSSLVLHYLYTTSLFPNHKNANEKAVTYYLGQAEKFWTKRGIYEQALIALSLKRLGKGNITTYIVASLRERALNNDELGMYWKSSWGYNWNEQAIETQALMIELFNEVGDAKSVDNLKIWLLKNKQTNAWKTTKATASAVYALLKTGDNWLEEDGTVDINVGGNKIVIADNEKEAGTGYFKTTFKKEDITAKQAVIDVKNPNKVVSWGAMYWQYFEDLDKIKDFKETPLTIVKQLFKQVNGDKGLEMKPLSEKDPLSIGDKIKVRIELRVDRTMEFVHMKDMRAAGFEPTNVLSQYKYQGGLGYYESTKDAATNFFFDYLPKGTYVFEYVLVVNNKGDMSNGITIIQCMYAPEFTSHSEGIRVKVK